MTPVRVLSVIHPFRPAFSGEAEWWLRLIPFLRARGVDVEILTSGHPNRPVGKGPEVIDGVPVHRIPIAADAPSYWRWIRGILVAVHALVRRRKRFDVALFHTPNHDTVFASCVAGRICGWKTIYKTTLLGSDDLQTIATSGKLGRLRLAALSLADGIISMSKILIRPYDEQPWVRDKLLMVRSGVDLQRFQPADPARKRAVREQLGIPQEARVVLFCGAVVHRKGIDLLVDAWPQVIAEVPNALLLIVGPNHRHGLHEPEYRLFSEAITRRVEDLTLRESVRLLGYQRQTDVYYAAADVFILPSRAEGWPNVIAEAMASGLPCVVSFLNGISDEYLEDGADGLIVRAPTPREYADRLVTLLRDPAMAQRMGARARRRAEELFAIEHIADQYAGFFQHILAGTPP